jgi:LPS-assembly lipoprotein
MPVQLPRFALWCCLTLLTACGFHLRGSVDSTNELKTLYISGGTNALRNPLSSFVGLTQTKITDNPAEAEVVVRVIKEDVTIRSLSLNATGKSNENELNFYLRFGFYDNQGNVIGEVQTLEISREFYNDQSTILAKSNEENVIRSEMYKQAARLIYTRAQAAAANKHKEAGKPQEADKDASQNSGASSSSCCSPQSNKP